MCYGSKSVVYEFFQLRSKVDVLWMVLYCRLDALSKKSTTMKTLAAIRPKDDETAAGATSMAAVVVLRGELRD